MRERRGRSVRLNRIVVVILTVLLFATVLNSIDRSVIYGQQPIRIGVVCDSSITEGQGIWWGAQIAMDTVNAKGGILGRQVELVYINHHAYPLDPSAAVLDLTLQLPNVDFLIGGHVSECVFPSREAVADYAAAHGKPIWIICGATTDSLIDCGYPIGDPRACGKCVSCNYDRYKYFFRTTPFNDTTLFKSVVAFLRYYLLPQKLAKVYGSPVKTYILAENLVWADSIVAVLAGSGWVPEIAPGIPNPYPSPPDPYSLLGPEATVVGIGRSAYDETDFTGILDDISAKKARLIIPIFGAPGGISFVKQWGTLHINAIPYGINVEAMKQGFWNLTQGACEYFAMIDTMGTRTPITPEAVAFWDTHVEKFGQAPVTNSFSAYSTIMALAEAVNRAGTIDSNVVIPALEQLETDTMLGRLRFTQHHEAYVSDECLGPTWPQPRYLRAFSIQWQKGVKAVTYPEDQSFSKKFRLPPWMYELADVDIDFSGGVDIRDVARAAKAFGTSPGDVRWDIEADVDVNGKIDIRDIASIAKNFGNKVPQWPLP
jgi:branched-chain amino acid transport system substrate-binding protein